MQKYGMSGWVVVPTACENDKGVKQSSVVEEAASAIIVVVRPCSILMSPPVLLPVV